MTPTAARHEERRARERERQLERMRRAAAQARETDTARAIREAAHETRTTYKSCRCDFRGVRTKQALLAMGGGCTMPSYACPRLTAVRQRVKAWG